MKIAIYALHLGFGGVEKYVCTIANILCQKYEVEIIATYKMVAIPAFPLDKKVKVTYLIEHMQPNKVALKKAIKSFKIGNSIKEIKYAYQLLQLKNNLNIKSIKECTSDVIISTRDFHNTLIQKYAAANIIKISSEHNHHNENKEYIKQIVQSVSQFDYFLPISKQLTQFYAQQLPNIDVRYIPFCIDESTCVRTKNHSHKRLISVGRISAEKGMIELVDMFEKMSLQQADLHLDIVGDGPLMDALKRKVEPIKHKVTLHGFLPKSEIDCLYAQSSLYVMASHSESFGLVLLEAMSNELACIAFDRAQGATEIIQDGVNGYLIANNDENAYMEQILELLNHPEHLEQLSKQAFQSIRDYKYANTEEKWLSLMSEVENRINKANTN